MNVKLLLLLGTSGIVAAVAARADDAPGASSAATLEVITVTAQRRSENLQDVPIAVTAVTASQLQAQGVTSTQDLGQAVSALTISPMPFSVTCRRSADSPAGPADTREAASVIMTSNPSSREGVRGSRAPSGRLTNDC